MVARQDQPRDLGAVLTTIASLTNAQHALLRQISQHSSPVTVTELAEESGLHVSSVRETLEALCSLGIVVREQLPAQGRGRPAHGYLTYTPTDPAFGAQMLGQATQAIFSWLRDTSADPEEAAYDIGRRWGDEALSKGHVPDHTRYAKQPSPGFLLVNHMDKIRLFLTAMGFAAAPHPHEPTSLVLGACPYTDPDAPDPLALALRRGVVERILDRTAAGLASVAYIPDPDDPVRVTVRLSERDGVAAAPPTTVRFFGGAEEAAGVPVLRIPAAETPPTLADLLGGLARSRPPLTEVFEVSSFTVDSRAADGQTALSAGAEIEVLPPFSGG
ncbi:MAG: MarR family transcriptional regulator [Actinomycetaceae bacterium]|nr:MarR family transcriptional regulator [Actinomycetaceae bacterium]